MAVYPTFPGGDPNRPWDKQPWDAAKPQHDENGGAEGVGVGEEIVGGVVEGVAEAAAYGCLEGCGGCSCALFLAAGSAMAAAVYRLPLRVILA